MVDSISRYAYLCHSKSESVDIHHILPPNNGLKGFLLCFSALLIFANVSYLFLVQDNSFSIVLWSLLVDAILVKLLLGKAVKKESVIVMPAFGVQLETHYVSGKVSRRFIPVDKILKPVLVECVTPFTCYWSLCLILRDESQLTSVFKGLRPPVNMLIPIWKALRAGAATDEEESSTATTQDDVGQFRP